MSTMAPTFLLHHAYNHALNALVLPPLSTVGDINNNKWRPAGQDNDKQHPEGWDGPEGGGHNTPPLRWR